MVSKASGGFRGTLADGYGSRFGSTALGTGVEFRKGRPEGTSDHRLARSGAEGFGTPRESAAHHWKPGSPKPKPEVLETPAARI